MYFHALVEKGSNESIAYFRDLPGCIALAPTPRQALHEAFPVITDYLQWLKQNGIVLFEENPEAIDVVLEEALEFSEEAGGPIFKTDLVAPNDVEIINALNVAATMRALIIELVTNMPPSSPEQATEDQTWSLSQHFTHIMETETWYVSRLQEHPTVGALDPMLTIDDKCMKFFENAIDYEIVLRDLPSEQRAHIFTHEGEAWTLAKVLRRMTGHLSEHYSQMEALTR